MKRYKSQFNEASFSATTELDLDVVDDQDILRIAISAELSAINLYRQLALIAEDNKLYNVLMDIAREEKVHVGELQQLLEYIDDEELDSNLEGREEIEEI